MYILGVARLANLCKSKKEMGSFSLHFLFRIFFRINDDKESNLDFKTHDKEGISQTAEA